MKKLLLLLLMAGSVHAAFNEFYCRSGGDNLNAGSTTNVAAIYTAVGDSDGTSVFTPSDGSTPATTLTNGAWGSVYVTAGATVSTFVGLVTNVAAGVNGAVTFSQVAKAGTFPSASGGAHTITLKQGGAWKGPNAVVCFPTAFANNRMTNTPGVIPRVNLLADATYAITATLTNNANDGPIRFQGMTNSPGDLGKATIDCATAGAGLALYNISANGHDYFDLIFSNSGATSGTTDGILGSSSRVNFVRCVVHDVRRTGWSLVSMSVIGMIECEAYLCNKNNSGSEGGFRTPAACTLVRCISHDNLQVGFSVASPMVRCISDSNTGAGVVVANAAGASLSGCDIYNNGSHGIDYTFANDSPVLIENCNLIKNGGAGIASSGNSTLRHGLIVNCAFGSGTMTNAGGNVLSVPGTEEVGSIIYTANAIPWVDAPNGDFRITLSASKSAGRGNFTQTQASYSGAVGYPDIGAAQASDTNSVAGGGTVGYGFAQ